LKIDSALTLVSFPGRDDPDNFFSVISPILDVYVHDQQDGAIYHSDGMPSLLAFHDAILSKDQTIVCKRLRGGCEGDAMFAVVRPVLAFVPFELHRYTNCITVGSPRQAD
jgi:hypothetical protein